MEAEQLYDILRPYDPQAIEEHELVTRILYGEIDDAAQLLEKRPVSSDSKACLALVIAARRKEPYDAVEFSVACGGAGEWTVRYYALAGDLDAAYQEMGAFSASNERFPALSVFGPEMKDFLRDPRFFPLAGRLGLVDYWLYTDQWPDFCSEPDLPFDCRERAQAARVGRTATGAE